MAADLTDRVALVTGGGSGIGRASALAFARAGAKVAVAGRRLESLDETVADIVREGGEAFAVATDISVEAEVVTMVQATVARFGALHLAANVAGCVGGTSLVDLGVEEFDEVIGVNLRGTFLCLKHEVRAMLASGGGAVVNVSSVSAMRGGSVHYSASKAGVEGLSRAAAGECAELGIRVNALRAGIFETPMLRGIIVDATDPAEMEREYVESNPMKRIADPAEAAAAIVWLCSPAASFVTGTCMEVDGGQMSHW